MKKSAIFRGVLSWVIPFIVSFFMINPETKEYLPNPIVFKIVMALLLIGIVYRASKHLQSSWLKNATTFLIINVILDIIILIGVFKVPVMERLMSIVPMYIVLFFGGFYLLGKSKKIV